MADIKVYFTAINQASRVIKSIGEEMSQVFGPKQFDFAAEWGAFTTSVGAAVKVTGEIMRKIDDMTLQGARLEALGTAYEGMASSVGANSEIMLEDLKKASGGLINEADLMLAANRAILLNVADDTAKMETLIKTAIVRGRAMGRDATSAFNDLVLGIGRISPELLDNIGVAIRVGPVYTAYAKTIGKTADELTDAEKKLAIYNEVLRQSGDILKDVDKVYASNLANLERAQIARQNLMATIQTNMAGPFSGMSIVMADIFETANQLIEGDLSSTTGFADEWLTATMRIGGASEEMVNTMMKDIDTARQLETATNSVADSKLRLYNAMSQARNALEEAAAASHRYSEEQELLFQRTLNAGNGLITFASLARSTGQDLNNLTKYVEQLNQRMNNFTAQFDQINSLERSVASSIISSASSAIGLMGGKEATAALVREQLAALEATTSQLKNQNLDAVELQLTYAELRENLTGPFTSAIEANRAGQKAWKSEVKETEKAFDDLKGKVEGILSGALDPGVGVNPSQILEELGMRPDAINENARRMADIAVNGFKSPWFDYFKDEFPALFQQFFAGANGESGVRAQAAQLLQNFQDGLMPEFLDKEQAKERVKRMLIGEQRMADLAQEIAQELSTEMSGVTFSKALSAAQGALGGGSSANNETGYTSGDAFKAGLIDSVKAGDLGSQIATHLADQILAEGNLAISNEAGRQHGAAWGQGFLSEVGDNVPPELIDLLATLVTPAVIARQNVRATQTGAVQ